MNRIGAVVVREIRATLPALIFFLCLFHLIVLTKAVIINDFDLSATRATAARRSDADMERSSR